jgi:hypothetical protein
MGMMNMMIGNYISSASGGDTSNIIGSHAEGTDLSTTIPNDAGSGNYTISGNASISTTYAKYGSSSFRISASGVNSVSKAIPGTFSLTQPWQMEGWMRCQQDSNNMLIIDPVSKMVGAVLTYVNSTTVRTSLYLSHSGGTFTTGVTTTVPSNNAWFHVSVGFDGTTHRAFLDGVQKVSTTLTPVHSGALTHYMEASSQGTAGYTYFDDVILYQNKNIRPGTGFTPPGGAWT